MWRILRSDVFDEQLTVYNAILDLWELIEECECEDDEEFGTEDNFGSNPDPINETEQAAGTTKGDPEEGREESDNDEYKSADDLDCKDFGSGIEDDGDIQKRRKENDDDEFKCEEDYDWEDFGSETEEIGGAIYNEGFEWIEHYDCENSGSELEDTIKTINTQEFIDFLDELEAYKRRIKRFKECETERIEEEMQLLKKLQAKWIKKKLQKQEKIIKQQNELREGVKRFVTAAEGLSIIFGEDIGTTKNELQSFEQRKEHQANQQINEKELKFERDQQRLKEKQRHLEKQKRQTEREHGALEREHKTFLRDLRIIEESVDLWEYPADRRKGRQTMKKDIYNRCQRFMEFLFCTHCSFARESNNE